MSTTSDRSCIRSRTTSRPSAETSKSTNVEVCRKMSQLPLVTRRKIDQPQVFVLNVLRAAA